MRTNNGAGFCATAMGALLLGAGMFVSNEAQALALPDCSVPTGNNCIVFGDFEVFSLPFLNFLATGKTSDPSNGDPFWVPSSPGQIKDLVVSETGASGVPVNTNFPGMDDAYETPSGVAGSSTFTTTDPGDPGPGGPFSPEFGGDGEFSWDTRVDALNSFLAGEGLLVFFNLNEDNSEDPDEAPLVNQDLLLYAEVTLGKDSNGDTMTFVLNGNTVPAIPNTSISETDHTNPDPWAWVHGAICVDDTAAPGDRALIHLGACGSDDPALAALEAAAENPTTMNQNLGANVAAFAVRNPDLDIALQSGEWDFLQFRLDMSRLSNGFEQVFITSAAGVPVPEPATLLLFGAGLAGLGFAARRRRRT